MTSMPRKPFALLFGLLLLALPLLAASDPPSRVASASGLAQADSQYFPETGHTVKGLFLRYWREHGGLAQQGYPISEEMQEKSDLNGKTYTVQYFERAVFELHPENTGTQYEVLLSQLGTFEFKQRYPNGPVPTIPHWESARYFPETKHYLGGAFRDYWEAHGGLVQQGYPITDQFTEVSKLDGKEYTVQYFERAAFEIHPENAGTPYEVLLSQLGRFQYDRRYRATPTPTATSTAAATPGPTPGPEVAAWLRDHAIPFNTSQPGGDYSDLMPLKKIIGDARIVSLGEATHGTHEFFAMKHRMLEFLVKEMGFNTFAMEAGWGESNLINDYVHTGNGDPSQLLKGLGYWTWNTQEVLDMIKWMRAHNQNPGNEPIVSFQGFDIQGPHIVIDNVVAYVQRVDPPSVGRIQARYDCFRPYQDSVGSYASAPQATKSACHQDAQQAYNELNGARSAYEKLSSPGEFARALQSARIVVQAEDAYSSATTSQQGAARDLYMAENASWILQQAGKDTKIALWAHNFHVGTSQAQDYKSMGQHLREQYGDQIINFGFDFYGGAFNAFSTNIANQSIGSLTSHQVQAPPVDSYEAAFHSAGIPRLFVDMRGIQSSTPATNWLTGPHPFRFIGAAYDDSRPDYFFSDESLPKKFDALIYFQDTTPSVLLK